MRLECHTGHVIFQNWTYDGHVEADQVSIVRACSPHNFEEVQSGSSFCTYEIDVGIPFHVGGEVYAQDLERSHSFDSVVVHNKLRRWILLQRTKDDFFRFLAVQPRVVHGSDGPAGRVGSGRVTILPDFGGSGRGRVSTSDLLVCY